MMLEIWNAGGLESEIVGVWAVNVTDAERNLTRSHMAQQGRRTFQWIFMSTGTPPAWIDIYDN